MAAAYEEKDSIHSDDQNEENSPETVSGQLAAAEEAGQGQHQQPKKKSYRKRPRTTIDWCDQATLSPAKPKNFMTIEELQNAKKAKKKEQQEIAKAAKAARRKQKQLAEKANHLTNEELLEIVQQRRHRQEEKAKKGKAKASAGKEAPNVSVSSNS